METNKSPWRDSKWWQIVKFTVAVPLFYISMLVIVHIYYNVVDELMSKALPEEYIDQVGPFYREIFEWLLQFLFWFLLASPFIGFVVFVLSMGGAKLIRLRRKRLGVRDPGRLEAYAVFASFVGVFLAIAGIFSRPVIGAIVLLGKELILSNYDGIIAAVMENVGPVIVAIVVLLTLLWMALTLIDKALLRLEAIHVNAEHALRKMQPNTLRGGG